MSGNVTLSQVAKEAGVSVATASRAINGSSTRTVGPELRARVLAAAERLGYTPDANAQAVARGWTSSLGLVVHEIVDPYFSAIAAGVSLAADRAQLAVTLASTGHDAEREPQLVDLLARQRVRAIVVAGGRRDLPLQQVQMRDALARFRRLGGRVAAIGQPVFDVSTVVIRNRGGAAALARELHRLGYRRFGVLSGPDDHLTARDRCGGFIDALVELGCPPQGGAVVPSAFSRDGGHGAMRALLTEGPTVDVVFAVSDVMAVGAMAAAREAGVAVPGRIGMAGFDDIDTLRDITPALTTVRVPLVDVGIMATELALAESTEDRVLEYVDATVVLRDSTPGRVPERR